MYAILAAVPDPQMGISTGANGPSATPVIRSADV